MNRRIRLQCGFMHIFYISKMRSVRKKKPLGYTVTLLFVGEGTDSQIEFAGICLHANTYAYTRCNLRNLIHMQRYINMWIKQFQATRLFTDSYIFKPSLSYVSLHALINGCSSVLKCQRGFQGSGLNIYVCMYLHLCKNCAWNAGGGICR